MTVNQLASNHLQKAMLSIATGKKINSAADNASGLAISEKLQSQINGLKTAETNTGEMSDVLKTADGGLSTINDSLQRVRDLSLQASNGTLDDSDKSAIQNEINQTLQGINDIAGNTQYNNKNLLDGSFANEHTASSPDGSGKDITIGSFSTASLNLDTYSVTSGNVDLTQIDSAMGKVNDARSQIGADTNVMQYTMDSNSITALNLAAANSRIADTDVAKAATDMNTAQLLNTYQTYAQSSADSQAQSAVDILA